MYSLRHTFASLGRVAGKSAFNGALGVKPQLRVIDGGIPRDV
jgi:hypothetical protein